MLICVALQPRTRTVLKDITKFSFFLSQTTENNIKDNIPENVDLLYESLPIPFLSKSPNWRYLFY